MYLETIYNIKFFSISIIAILLATMLLKKTKNVTLIYITTLIQRYRIRFTFLFSLILLFFIIWLKPYNLSDFFLNIDGEFNNIYFRIIMISMFMLAVDLLYILFFIKVREDSRILILNNQYGHLKAIDLDFKITAISNVLSVIIAIICLINTSEYFYTQILLVSCLLYISITSYLFFIIACKSIILIIDFLNVK